MKILFGVCTEGNGHLIQAIAIKEHMDKMNHVVSCVFAAKKKKESLNFLQTCLM